MPVYRLPKEPVFPPAEKADEDGLIAVGGDFDPERLLQAYAAGIFPWFVESDIIYWFSPDPRLVLFPEDFHVQRSLQRLLATNRFTTKMDTRFHDVISRCASISRKNERGTWISEKFIEGYDRLHQLGFAHSFETYEGDQLVGGLYGISLGKAFFGESMFHNTSNASKIALVTLMNMMKDQGFYFVDCQTYSDHFTRMGAQSISRVEYLERLDQALKHPTMRGSWNQWLT
jgi:leucyl/phenylalanyl-tRNA---protein transferase